MDIETIAYILATIDAGIPNDKNHSTLTTIPTRISLKNTFTIEVKSGEWIAFHTDVPSTVPQHNIGMRQT